MALRGGDLKQLLVGGRELTPVADGDFSFSTGGLNVEAKLSGNGLPYAAGKKEPAYFKGPVLGDTTSKVLEFLQGLEDTADPVPVTFTWASGDTYSGSLFITGHLEMKKDGSIDLDLEGGRLERI